MRLVLIGCEYSGTTTLARSVFDWANANLDGGTVLFHDHWKLPFTSGHQEHDPPLAPTAEEQEQVLALSPKLKEMYNRYSLYYHINPGSFRGPDFMAVGLHIEESIYGPLYWGYGIKGPVARRRRAPRRPGLGREGDAAPRPRHGAWPREGLPGRDTPPHGREPTSTPGRTRRRT